MASRMCCKYNEGSRFIENSLVSFDLVAEIGADRCFGQQIDFSPDGPGELAFQGHDGEQALGPGELDQQINVAPGVCFSARYRTKDAQLADVVLPPRYEAAEVLNLQAIRDAARKKR